MSVSPGPTPRIASMDQFRGYTVAGMFVVNFLSSFAVIHPVLKHNDIYFSYADSIMPSFLFAVGFSFRLTFLRRRQQAGYWPTVFTYVRRSFALVVVSLVMYGFGSDFHSWKQFSEMPPEFQPFRPKAPRTHSFDELISQAREANPRADERAILAQASAMGASIVDPRLNQAKGDPRLDQVRQAADVADREASQFVGPALRRIQDWNALSQTQKLLVHLRIAAAKLLKSDLWETLAIIGVTQLVVLPFIGWNFLGRFVALVALGSGHLLISYWFNWDFLYALNDNWMSKLWMTGHSRGWDGGFFGPMCWAVAMLAGTLAYDLVIGAQSRAAGAGRLIVWGIAFMAVGYGMSCLTRLYELSAPELEARRIQWVRQQAERNWLGMLRQREQRRLMKIRRAPDGGSEAEVEAKLQVLDDQSQAYPNLDLAESPVLPAWNRVKDRTWRELLAEPPFIAPPRDDPKVDPQPSLEHRPRNYWMLGKRGPNLSFITFASGFAFALYGLFVIACDLCGLSVGFFRTFGTNALAAYFLHHVIEEQVAGKESSLVPHDSPLWYCLCGFALFFLLTYACVRYLEKQKIYIRL
ncbi:MAG TPA: heparan-alpha-glucosaminide N-acetyltransferase domain-containing protein [Planctomycetaceae bacterium]|nr:heparan-alpha-glucosaminide N-acetyltransferase domain-containing protein [Planctomycetaceae bacterium]